MTKTNLWAFFTTSCFEGFNPKNEKNFYKVYGDLFKTLDQEEEMEEAVGVEHNVPLLGD